MSTTTKLTFILTRVVTCSTNTLFQPFQPFQTSQSFHYQYHHRKSHFLSRATQRLHQTYIHRQHQQQQQHQRKRNLAWTCSATSNDGLIDNLVKESIIKSKRIEDTMRIVDRKYFLPDETDNKMIYADIPQPLIYSATISAPHMHALALELLEGYLQPNTKALDVGSGSGFLCACMSLLVGKHDNSKVVGIEHIKELSNISKVNIENLKDNCIYFQNNSSRIVIKTADGRINNNNSINDSDSDSNSDSDRDDDDDDDDDDQNDLYSCIHVGAAADQIPIALINALKAPGAMVIPVGPPYASQKLQFLVKNENGIISEKTICYVRYVPLCDAKQQINSKF